MSAMSLKEVETFASDFGEHMSDFFNNINYKNFVQELVKDLANEMDIRQLADLQQFVDRLVQTRAKEEKNGDVQYMFHKKAHKNSSSDDDDDSSDNNEADLYADFM